MSDTTVAMPHEKKAFAQQGRVGLIWKAPQYGFDHAVDQACLARSIAVRKSISDFLHSRPCMACMLNCQFKIAKDTPGLGCAMCVNSGED
ncbi:hypothetical protein B0G38_002552 [Arthrobacter sp. VKM Ac-2550]|nr:hypothetical protein [Arthrobacter sp. VKM Ac-2550]